MAKTHSNLIGIAITEKSVQVVECRGSGASAKAGKRISFAVEGSTLFDAPDRFGKQLAEQLEQAGCSSKHAAVGLCGRWVLARAMTLPPVEGDALAGMLRLKIEGEFAGGQGELCFDYQDAPLPDAANTKSDQRGFLLAGMPKRRLESIRTAMTAAGLTLQSVSASPLDIDSSAGSGLDLIIDPAGITLRRSIAGRTVGFASAGFDTAGLVDAPDAAERLAATATRLAMSHFSDAVGASNGVGLTDTADLDGAARESLVAALAQRFGHCDAVAADPALATARQSGRSDGINWLDSKLAVKPARTMPSYAKWLLRAAVLLLLVGGVVGYLWLDATRELAAVQDEYDTIRDSAAKLQTVREDTRAASGWFDDRPPVLDCLLELTHTFPREGRIWVTNLSIDPDATGTVSCRADDEDTMWLYVNAMNASPRLKNVALRRQGGVGRDGGEIVFDVSFRYDESASTAEEVQ